MVGMLDARIGADVTGITYARQTEEFIERIGGMARERPSRAHLWNSMRSRLTSMSAKLFTTGQTERDAFCPKMGTKVQLHSSGKYYCFDGYKIGEKFVPCWVTNRKRRMSAQDYVDIFSGGDRGGGPFKLTSKEGNEFEAYLVWRPKKKEFELLFKR
jgi:hypothetical protein